MQAIMLQRAFFSDHKHLMHKQAVHLVGATSIALEKKSRLNNTNAHASGFAQYEQQHIRVMLVVHSAGPEAPLSKLVHSFLRGLQFLVFRHLLRRRRGSCARLVRLSLQRTNVPYARRVVK